MAENIQEYVIALSSKIDNQGVSRILSLLDSTKLKALGITTAISAATTAVYKFVESATKEELRLQQLAKQQQKNIEQIRSTETAMKSMGKTLNEINKDKALQEIYKDIVKFNDSLALPNMDNALNRINELRGAVWKLKSAVQYVVQWVNARILANLAEPIDDITKKVKGFTFWMRDNLTSITTRISSYITGFAKGVYGIFQGIEKIVGFVNDLPDGVKKVGIAIGTVFALLKSGPVGQILSAITLIGGLIDDYQNFKWNIANGFSEGDEGYVGVALPGIWERVEGGMSGIGEFVLEKLNKAIEDIPAEELGSSIGAFVTRFFELLNEAVTGDGKGGLLSGLATVGSSIAKGIFTFLSSFASSINLGTVKEAIQNTIGKFFSLIGEALSGTSDFLNTVSSEAGGSENGGSIILTIAEGIVGGIAKGIDALKEQGALESIKGIVNSIFGMISKTLSAGLTLVLGEETTDGEYKDGLLQYGAQILEDIIQVISESIEGIQVENVMEGAENIVMKIFSVLSRALSTGFDLILGKPNADGGFEGGLLQNGATIVESIINIIAKGVENVHFDNIVSSANDIVSKIFSFLSQALTTGFELILGHPNSDGGFEGGLIQQGATIIENVIKIIAKGLGNVSFENVTESVNDIVGKVFSFLSQALATGFELILGNPNADGGLEGGLLQTGASIIENIINIIAQGIERVNFGNIQEGTNDIVTKVISFLTQALETGLKLIVGNPNADGGFEGGLMQQGASIIENIINIISQGIGNVDVDKVATGAEEIVSKIFSTLSGALSSGLATVLGHPNEKGEWEKGLLGYGVDLFRSIISFIGEGVKSIGDSDIGLGIGEFVNTILTQIGDFLSETPVPVGDALVAVTNIAQGIMSFILKGMEGMTTIGEDGKTGIQRFIEGFFDFITSALTDMVGKIETGELDFTELGAKIGTFIGKSIVLTVDFLGNFVADAMAWLANGGFEQIAIIGKEILKAIISGLGNVFDAIMEALFGSAWSNFKNDMKDRSELHQEIDLMAAENGGVFHTEDGDLTTQQAHELNSNTSNVSTTRKILGLEEKTEFEIYRKGLLGYLGLGDLFTGSVNGGTIDSGGTMQMDQVIARALGIALSEDRTGFNWTDENGGNHWASTTYGGEADQFNELMGNVLGADTIEGFQSAFTGLKEYLDQMGVVTTSEDKLSAAFSKGALDVQTAAIRAASATEDMSDALSDAIPVIESFVNSLSENGGTVGDNAYGGRYSSPLTTHIAEDGDTEYIIPIRKLDRALPLINQMLAEMGANLSGRVMSGLGVGEAGTLGASLGSVADMITGGNTSNVYTISAPVSIVVNANGADGEAIGRGAYDAAEQQLLETVRGVFA